MVVMTRPGVGMVMLMIVLPQQILAIVIAVRRAHHGVDVVARRFVVVVNDTRLVIELDQDHRTQDAIVEWAGIVEWADPGEQRVAQLSLRFGIANIGMSWPQPAGIDTEQSIQALAAFRRQIAVANTDRIDA